MYLYYILKKLVVFQCPPTSIFGDPIAWLSSHRSQKENQKDILKIMQVQIGGY